MAKDLWKKKRTIKLAWEQKKQRIESGNKTYSGNYLWRMYYTYIIWVVNRRPQLEHNIKCAIQKVERTTPHLLDSAFAPRYSPKKTISDCELKRKEQLFCGKNESVKKFPLKHCVWQPRIIPSVSVHIMLPNTLAACSLRSSFDEIPCI